MNSIVSITTDQGTEVGIGELPVVDVRQSYHGETLAIEYDDGGGQGQAQLPRETTDFGFNFMFPFTLVVTGMLRIMHILVEDTCKALPCWSWLLSLLRPLAAFLRSGDAKDRFIERCVRGSDQENYEYLLKRPFVSLYVGRWEALCRSPNIKTI